VSIVKYVSNFHSVQVTFVDTEGHRKTVPGLIGTSLLDVAREHDIPLYADPTCVGELACTSCHVIVSNEFYDHVPQPSADENEILEVAAGLSEK
jgi:ferredoxin